MLTARNAARLLRRLARAREGAIAVEFAFTFPVLLIMLFGMVELENLVATQHRMFTAGSSIDAVIGRIPSLTTASETNIFAAATDIMGSTASSPPNLRVSQVIITNTGTPKYEWSDVQGAAYTPYARCAKSVLPQLLSANAPALASGQRVLVAEIQYTWASPFSYVLKQPIVLNSTTVISPRAGDVNRDWGGGSTSDTLSPACTGS